MTAEHRGGQNQHGARPAPRTPRLFPADAQQTSDSMDRESPLAKNPRCHEPGAAGGIGRPRRWFGARPQRQTLTYSTGAQLHA